VDCRAKPLLIDEQRTIKLQVWAVKDDVRFREVSPTFYRGAHGLILVYEISNEQSFTFISGCIENIMRSVRENADPIQMMLLGCCKGERRVVSSERGQELAQAWGIPFMECSLSTGANVKESYTELVNMVTQAFPPPLAVVDAVVEPRRCILQ
jgi:GTPase SAR1 family protein